MILFKNLESYFVVQFRFYKFLIKFQLIRKNQTYKFVKMSLVKKNSFCSELSTNSSKVQQTAKVIKETIAEAINQLKQEIQMPQDELPISAPLMPFIKRISLDLQQQKTFKLLQKLKEGFIVKKHSPNTSQPHDKFIYVSDDHRFFCWKSTDKNDEKKLQLKKVKNVYLGRKMAKSKTIQKLPADLDKFCLVIESEIRSLEIQANNEEVIDLLYTGITDAVKNSKRLHLSYQL